MKPRSDSRPPLQSISCLERLHRTSRDILMLLTPTGRMSSIAGLLRRFGGGGSHTLLADGAVLLVQ